MGGRLMLSNGWLVFFSRLCHGLIESLRRRVLSGEEERDGYVLKSVSGGFGSSGWDLGTVSMKLSVGKSPGEKDGWSGLRLRRVPVKPVVVSVISGDVCRFGSRCSDRVTRVLVGLNTWAFSFACRDAWRCVCTDRFSGLGFCPNVFFRLALCFGIMNVCGSLMGLVPLIKIIDGKKKRVEASICAS